MDGLDLDINNYTIKDLEKFFQLAPGTKYTLADLELKEAEIRELLLSSGHINKKFKRDLIDFLQTARKWLATVKCPSPATPSPDTPIDNTYSNSRTQELMRREPTPYVHALNSEYFPDHMNPLKTRVISKYLNIDTRFRDNIFTTSSSDFTFNLPLKLNKVVSMQITAFEFPVAFYGISSKYGNNYFYVSATQQMSEMDEIFTESKVIVIPDGNYSAVDFTDVINSKLSQVNPDNTPVDPNTLFNSIKFFLDLSETGSGTAKLTLKPYGPLDYTIKSIVLDFSRDINGNPDPAPITNKIGLNMGFLKKKYLGATSYTGETIVEPANIRYLYLAVDDFNNNVNNYFISAFNNSIMSPNILARISIKGSYFSLMMETDLSITTEPRKYFGPVDIQKLHIRVYDDHGRILDTNNSNFSCCILFKMLYDL